MNHASHGKLLFESVLKSIGGKYSLYIIQLFSMIILARLFTPEEFGVFAIIQVFALFFTLVSDVGLVPALVNEKNVSNKMRNSVFGFTLVVGLIVCIIFWAISPAIAWFYDYSSYEYLVIPVAISVIFNAFSIVPTAAFTRDRKFLHIASADILGELISLFATLLIIWQNKLDTVMVLSLKPLIYSIVKFLVIWYSSEKTELGRAYFGFDLKEVKPLFRFSSYQFLSNIMIYFSRNLDNLLVGKYFGASDLGVYDKSYKLMRYPLMLLTFAMAPAIQPALKELNEDKKKFEEIHNKFISYLALIGGIAGFGMYVLAENIVLILLGNNWLGVAKLLQILSVSIPIQIVLSSSGGFFQAANRPDLMLNATIFSFCTNSAAIIYAIFFGDLEVLCWSISLSFTINFFQCYYLLCRYVFCSFNKNLFVSFALVLFCSTLLALLNIFCEW